MGEDHEYLDVTLDVPSRARVGAPVEFVIRLRYSGREPRDVYLRGREITFDLAIVREGELVWHRLDDATVPAIALLRQFQPGEALEWREQWVPSQPGGYSAHALVLTETGTINSNQADFFVRP